MNIMLFVVIGLIVALIIVNKLDKSNKKKKVDDKNSTDEIVEDKEQLNK